MEKITSQEEAPKRARKPFSQEAKDRIGAIVKRRWEDPEYLARVSASQKRRYQNPEVMEAQLKHLRSPRMRQLSREHMNKLHENKRNMASNLDNTEVSVDGSTD